MLNKIKNGIERELKAYIKDIDRAHGLSRISPLLLKSIREFLLRKGKRIRPSLFIIGYLGFARKAAPGLYRSALSLELLHDFMLVHDDIIDKSSTRRGKPSMHALLNRYLNNKKNLKFSGEDLTIVAGDVMYAMALHAFTAAKETGEHKEAALRKLIEAALYTGSGEFVELLLGLKGLDKTSRKDIYKIYDLKTANYTFASPLAIGASLAGASPEEVNKLFRFGMILGRAFQVKDDIVGLFCTEKETGKSNLSDLREAKKTLLILYAYQNSSKEQRKIIAGILGKSNAGYADLSKVRRIIIDSGALDFSKAEVKRMLKTAEAILKDSRLKKFYKELLLDFAQKTLAI
jgi:geranylgeranyl diphosphate synthase type I